MATPSHAMMLREISAAGDRERTGALDVAWDHAHASLFFRFGLPRHVIFVMADGQTLAGDDALAALVAELPTEIEAATWRRAMVTEETLDLTADELIALFETDASPPVNGTTGQPPEPDASIPVNSEPPAPPAPPMAPSLGFVMTAFPPLPLGPVLWSDAMANVVDLEVMVPLLPDCLLVLTRPEPQAAALVAGGAITDAVWMTGGHGQLGDDAARALMNARKGHLTAYRIDEPGMLTVLRTLLREPGGLVTVADANDPPPASEPIAEQPALIVEPERSDEATREAAAPTFDLTFAYAATLGRESVAPSVNIRPTAPGAETLPRAEELTWSTRDSVAPRSVTESVDVGDVALPVAPPAQFGPVGRPRLALSVSLRVLVSLGAYALIWQQRSNRELDEFDPHLPARPARSTLSGFVAWLAALLIALAAAAAFASSRAAIHLPFGRQLTSVEATYLVAGLACLYLVLILPFNLTAARTNLRRLRSVEEFVGISSGRRVRIGAALLMVIPVVGRLVLLEVEQRRINAIWKAATTTGHDSSIDVIVDRTPALFDLTDHEQVGAGADTLVETDTSIAAAVTDNAEADAESTATEAAAQESDEFGAIIAELEVVPAWLRLAAPQPEEAVEAVAAVDASEDAEIAGDVDVTAESDAVAEFPDAPAPAVTAEDDVPTDTDFGADLSQAESADTTVTTAVEEDANPIADPLASVDATLETDATFVTADDGAASPPELSVEATIAESVDATADVAEHEAAIEAPDATMAEAPPDEAVEATPMEQVEARETTEFVPPRLDIDVDALRGRLTEIAVKWLGADAAAPVATAIAAARPGVDDFVYAIAAIRLMDIPGHEDSIVRAMAREMHYYATEVLCAA